MNRHSKWFGLALVSSLLMMLVGVSYAWFSSNVSFLNGYVTLGELLIETTVYQPVYDSDGTINGVSRVTDTDESPEAYAAGLIAADSMEEGKVSTRFLKVENKGTMDVRLLLSLVKNEMLQNMSQYDSGYFQLAITDISDLVTSDKELSEYAKDLSSGVDAVTELSGKAYRLNRLTDRTISIGDTDDGILKKGETGYYRFDLFCQDLSSTVMAKYAAYQSTGGASDSAEGTTFTLDAKITAQQSNAPWSDSVESSAYTHEADSRESFLNAVESAESGDTIILMSDIVLEDTYNLTFYHRVNLNLNGHTLTVKGNMTYDFADSGSCTLNVSENAKLVVCGDFMINAPNSGFTIKGSEAAAVQIGNADRAGTFSVNCVRDYTDEQAGFVLDHVTLINATRSTAQDMIVYGDTNVSIGSSSVVGTITAASGARNIAIVNKGSISSIDFSSMSLWKDGQSDQIYIKNSGVISAENPEGITLPSWSAGQVTSPKTSNTTVIQEAGSGQTLEVRVSRNDVYYSAKNSQAFCDANASVWQSSWEPDSVNFWNQDVTTNELVVKVEKTADNMYVVYMDDENTDSVQTRMTDFFKYEAEKEYSDDNEVQQYAAKLAEDLQSLTIKTYGSAAVDTEDFSYIRSSFPNIQTLDLSSAALQNDAIPAEAMKSAEYLKKLLLPETVRTIGAQAFYGCNIEEITLPSSVTSVGKEAFQRDAGKSEKVYVTWNSENQIGEDVLSGFETAYTRIFMSEYQALGMETLDPAWSAYVYERYDFVIKDGSALTFLKEVDGTDGSDYARIVFYEDTGAFDKSMIQSTYMAGDGTPYPYRGRTFAVKSIGVNAFRLVGEANADQAVELLFPDTCTEIRANAFAPVTASHAYRISKLSLNYVNYIGENAFSGAWIMYSKARPSGAKGKDAFQGMIYLGSGAFADVLFCPADVEVADQITAAHFTGTSKKETVYEAGTLDLSANRSAWTGDWSSAQPLLAIRNMTAAAGIIKLNNYYRLGDYGYQENTSSESGIRLYGVWLDISGCEYLSGHVLKDSFPTAQGDGIQNYNVLDITNVKGFGCNAFENDYIGTVYAGVTDAYWKSEGEASFRWDAVTFADTDEKGGIFEGGSVLTLDIQGHVPASAQSGTSIFGQSVYGTVNLHLLAEGTALTEYLLADSTVDQIRIYDAKNVTFGKSCFANIKSSGEGGTAVSVEIDGAVIFSEAAFGGAKLKSFDFSESADRAIAIGDGAFYNISFQEMSGEAFTAFYGVLAKACKAALICGSTFPDDMKTLDLSENSVFAIVADGQYRGCNMNQITTVVWKAATKETTGKTTDKTTDKTKEKTSEKAAENTEETNRVSYDGIFGETVWPNLTSLSFDGVQLTGIGAFMDAKLPKLASLDMNNSYPADEGSAGTRNEYLLPQSTFEGAELSALTKLDLSGVCVQSFAFRSADLHSVTEIVTSQKKQTCLCNAAGTYDGQQFAHANLTGLKKKTTWHVAAMGRACFYDVRVGDGADWIFEDITGFSGYLNFSGITVGKLSLEFPALTSCIPKGAAEDYTRKQYLAQFDSSTAVYRIIFGSDFGKDGALALGGSCADTDGARITDCGVGAASTEFRGMEDCTVYFENATDVVQLFLAWDGDKIGTGVKFVVPQNLLTVYKEDVNWRVLEAQISGDDRNYTAFTYVLVENTADEVQLIGYSGDDTSLVVPETITASTDKSGSETKTYRVTQLASSFLSGSNRVKTLVLPSGLTYIDPALFDGTAVEAIRFYSSGDGSTAAYYRAENEIAETEMLDGLGERMITSSGKLLLSGAGTVLLRAVPGAAYESSGGFYEVPAAVKGIGSGAFRGTGITAISMTSVTSIAGDAFAGSAKDSTGNSIVTLRFAMAVPPVLSGDVLQIFRIADQSGESVRLEGTILVPGLDEDKNPTDAYLLAYQSASGFEAYQSLISADASLAPYIEEAERASVDVESLLTYTDGRGVTWYYTPDEADRTAVLKGVKEGIPANSEETFFLPAEVSDGCTWYAVTALDFTANQAGYLKEIVRYEVQRQMQADGTLPDVASQLYTDASGVLYRIGPDSAAAVLLRYPAASELEEYTIPEKLVKEKKTTVKGMSLTADEDVSTSDADILVATIAANAFYEATNLKALYIPTSVLRRISIEENAFAGTSDLFAVFGGDCAKDDVVILKTEVDQETWEKIKRWLNGEEINEGLPVDADPDADPDVDSETGEVQFGESAEAAVDETLLSEDEPELAGTDNAGGQTDTAADDELSETLMVSSDSAASERPAEDETAWNAEEADTTASEQTYDVPETEEVSEAAEESQEESPEETAVDELPDDNSGTDSENE